MPSLISLTPLPLTHRSSFKWPWHPSLEQCTQTSELPRTPKSLESLSKTAKETQRTDIRRAAKQEPQADTKRSSMQFLTPPKSKLWFGSPKNNSMIAKASRDRSPRRGREQACSTNSDRQGTTDSEAGPKKCASYDNLHDFFRAGVSRYILVIGRSSASLQS